MAQRSARNWPPGFASSLEYPEVPVGAILLGAADRYGERTAFGSGTGELSYAVLAARAAALANGLVAEGVRPGDRVAVRMPNCLEYPVAYYGILLAGAVFVPVNPWQPEPAVAAQVADAGAVRTLVAADVAALCAGRRETPPPVDIDVHAELAHLAYTGGTTGVSKGVRLPHRNVVVNTLQYACWSTGSVPATSSAGVTLDQVGPPEEWPVRLGTGVAINLTPWFHAMGTIAGLNAPVITGNTLWLLDRLDPALYLSEAQRLRVTSLGGAPALFAALLACREIATADLSSVRGIGSGAAPMPVEMSKRLHDIAPNAVIAEGYGLTEVTMGATGGPTHRSGVRKIGTVGVPIFDTEIEIRPDGPGPALPAGERGEVCISGPQVMLGYHNRPQATAEVLADGWLRTGDIGVLDDEGYLSIVDRKKDMLLYKGYNVYPRELEEILAAHGGVLSAAVVGRPDPAAGELPVAFVVRSRQEVTEAELMEAVNDQVVHYKHLREVHFVDQIPVSAAGKVLKRELRQRLTPQ